MQDPKKTFMETYNCEPTTHPKPESYAWRAKKQIYRPDFVLNHFVHYSIVTRQILDKPLDVSPVWFWSTLCAFVTLVLLLNVTRLTPLDVTPFFSQNSDFSKGSRSSVE